MHGDVGRTIPRGAGHEIPTLAELLVSNSDAGHGEANANAARGGHHGRPPRATKATTTIQAKKGGAFATLPRIKELASDTILIAGGV